MIKIQISQNDSNQRFDKFLRKLLNKSSLSLIFKLIRTNQIKLNNKKADPKTILHYNDIITIYLDDNKLKLISTVLFKNIASNDISAKISSQSYIDNITLYKDDDILALNKPPNIIVHPGGKWDIKDTLIFKIHQSFQDKSLTFKPTFVHRLDRETSGVILVALSMNALQSLTKQIRQRILKKNYITLVNGCIDIQALLNTHKITKYNKDWYIIDKPILKIKSEVGYNNPKISDDDMTAQRAITYFKIRKNIHKCTLCDIQLETGRMHQIRLHMQYIGHPVIGDNLYGNKKVNKYFLQQYNLHRQFLHASSIKFIHPKTNKEVTINAPLTNDLLFI